MKVTLCIDYTDERGSSTMLCRDFEPEWASVPRRGDQVEVLGPGEDESEWTSEVTTVYFYDDGRVELHVRGGRLLPDDELLGELVTWGYREPGREDLEHRFPPRPAPSNRGRPEKPDRPPMWMDPP